MGLAVHKADPRHRADHDQVSAHRQLDPLVPGMGMRAKAQQPDIAAIARGRVLGIRRGDAFQPQPVFQQLANPVRQFPAPGLSAHIADGVGTGAPAILAVADEIIVEIAAEAQCDPVAGLGGHCGQRHECQEGGCEYAHRISPNPAPQPPSFLAPAAFRSKHLSAFAALLPPSTRPGAACKPRPPRPVRPVSGRVGCNEKGRAAGPAFATACRWYQNTVTCVPTGTRSYRSMTCSLIMRMQPLDTDRPIDEGCVVP